MKELMDGLASRLGREQAEIASFGIEELRGEFGLPIIDVRSPGEFQRGHIPGASNIPVFDDAERSEIGTLYKQVGRSVALNRGLEIAEKKAGLLVDRVRQTVLESDFIVHCWRGGMRSEGFAWLCKESGLNPKRLEGGYKSFRRAAQQGFEQARSLVILGGHTGSGKTKLLRSLQAAGEQVIDLEGLAGHRGSVFGGLGKPPQPTVEQFENELYLQWRDTDPQKPLWLEGESRAIGRLLIPQPVWKQMSLSPIIIVEVELESRVEFLVEEYGDLPIGELASAIEKLKKRLGGLRLRLALEALDRNDLKEFTTLALSYYDKSYSKAIQMCPPSRVTKLPLSKAGDSTAVARLIELGELVTR